ncbi:MAG TPA: retropepsin-like aspartic protease [Pirellulales bacterium]|nr:retropepsin-like aspartic protease [Pirellulales bacterium]
MILGIAAVATGIVFALWRAWVPLPPPRTLTALLKQQQYVEVPLSRGTMGFLDVTAETQGHALLLYLDTGNTDNQLEEAVAVRLKLPRRRASVGIIAAKETDPPELVTLETSVGAVSSRIEALLNSQPANKGRKDNGEPPYDGLLGAPFLKENAAVIDCGSVQLFLRGRAHQPSPTAAAERARLLKDAGYIELPLTLRANGLPDVTAELNGERVVFLLDTGAQLTNLDQSLADRLRLPQRDTPGQFNLLLDGSELPLKTASVKQLAIGGISAPVEAVLLPMTKLNEWRQGEGYPPWAGLLGAEVLQRLGAVIDFEASKLFLLDPQRKRGR